MYAHTFMHALLQVFWMGLSILKSMHCTFDLFCTCYILLWVDASKYLFMQQLINDINHVEMLKVDPRLMMFLWYIYIDKAINY